MCCFFQNFYEFRCTPVVVQRINQSNLSENCENFPRIPSYNVNVDCCYGKDTKYLEVSQKTAQNVFAPCM